MNRLTSARALVLAALLLSVAPPPIARSTGPPGAGEDVQAVPLTINVTGTGQVTSSPAGIECTDSGGACTADFPSGTSVTLVATPPSGDTTTFPAACGATSSCAITVGETPMTVSVLFAEAPTFYLLVTGAGAVQATPLDAPPEADEDGVSNCNNAGWTSPTADVCREQFAPGRRIRLEVVPNGTNSTFLGWSDPACADQQACIVTMPVVPSTVDRWLRPYDLTVAASFGPVPIGILADVVGGGSVISTPPAINCAIPGDDDHYECSGTVEPGTTLTLHADNPAFVHWDPQECEPVPLSPSDCTIVPLTSVWLSLSLGTPAAPFREAEGPEVLVRFVANTTGSGSGHIAGGSIDCGSNCTSDYAFGRLATFTATPDTGSRFAGWRGGGCAEMTPTCTLTIGAASGITATFESDTISTTMTATTSTTTTTRTTPVVNPGVTPAAKTTPKAFRVHLAAASSIGRGNRRTLLVRIRTSLHATARISVRGPLLLVRRTYRVAPPQATLHVQLPPRARSGRYRLTITLTDALGRTRTLRPTITTDPR